MNDVGMTADFSLKFNLAGMDMKSKVNTISRERLREG